MSDNFFELLLIIVIISIAVYIACTVFFGDEKALIMGGAGAAALLSSINLADSKDDEDHITRNEDHSQVIKDEDDDEESNKVDYTVINNDDDIDDLPKPPQPSYERRPDNLEYKLLGGKSYDEYDDADLLNEVDKNFLNKFENAVIDGNNFIYKLKEISKDKSTLSPDAYTKYLEKSIDLLIEVLGDKGIFIVLKDPENDKQLSDFLQYVGEKNIRSAHKKYFDNVFKKYPNIRFVVAYGEAKHRDDYAAIWVSDVLTDTILLSRDRYRDVNQMSSSGIKIVVYGKGAAMLNKKINKPFTHVTKGVVKDNLIGYTFTKKRKPGFYEKTVNKKSEASDMVLMIRLD